MMTRSRKGGSSRSTTEEETSGGDTTTTGTTSGGTSETVTEDTTTAEDTTVVEDGDVTLIENKEKNKKAKSNSNKNSNKKKELEARLELERIQLEEIQIRKKLANTKLEIVRAENGSDDSEEEDAEAEAAAAKATAAWVSKTKNVERNEGEPRNVELHTSGAAPSTSNHTNQLAEAIMEAVKSAAENKASSIMQRAPKYVSELHQFDGDARDWMAFKATYEDTQALFSDIENMGRLRRAIKGKAKEAVKSLLFTQVDPREVITALERRFGRPTYLIRSEIENIEKLPAMSEDARELVRYAGAVSNTVSVVKQMKKQSYLHSSDISNRIIEKMCTLVRFKWFEYRATKEDEDEPVLLSLMHFFNKMVDQFEMHEFMGSKVKREGMKIRARPTGSRGVHTARATRDSSEEEYTSDEEHEHQDGGRDIKTKSATVCSCKEDGKTEHNMKITCPQCKGEHPLLKCKKFVEASIQGRWEQAKKTGTCFKCLERRHRGFNCRAKPCSKCKKSHHLLLHYEDVTKQKTQEDAAQTIASTINAARTISRAYLKIIPVELMGPETNAHVYALLDEGSTVTLIEEEIVNKIGAHGPEEELRIEGVGGHRMNQKSKKIDVKIRGMYGRSIEKLTGYSVKNLHLTPQEINEKDLMGCEHLNGLEDQLKYPNAKPTVLIGQDNWHLIVSQEVKHGDRSKPVASRTQLGWVLHGTRSSSNTPVRMVNHIVTQPSAKDDHLEKLIKNHFDIEALGIAAKKPSNDIDQRALEVLDSTTKRLSNGRFSTGLIWKTKDESLPESKIAAARRLRNLEKKFLKDKDFEKKYEEQVINLIKSDYAEKATEKAYACAVYWRSEHPQVEVKLLAAKARVSPLKPTSIPRLELQACLMGSRLATSLEQEMDLQVSRRYFWTDSKTALAWIKSDPRRYKPFVAHRLAEIEELTKRKEWRWVPTKHNVSDDATREAPRNFDNHHRWFKGPEFLYEDSEKWPADERKLTTNTGEEKHSVMALNKKKLQPTIIPEPARFSKWTRLLHATARLLQIVDTFKRILTHKTNATKRITRSGQNPVQNSKEKTPWNRMKTRKNLNLRAKSALYVEKAERLLMQRVQEDSYPEELTTLRNQDDCSQVSKLKNFTIRLEDGLIRLSTRIGAAKYLSAAYKNPIILDGHHKITQLLVKHVHEKLNHGNHQTVMNELRQRYWIPGLRNLVKTTARTCGWCKVHKRTPQLAPQGDLPEERLTRANPPFTCVGIDYFGPLLVTIGRRVEKRWGALFTCMTTRAIHLELASSLTTDSMILALRRMIARRGTPKIIMSDNGTNFIGANREIQEAIQAATNQIGIVWRFIPPGAPHMGGAWERLVRTVKTALAATLHERRPREEVLHTLLLEAEHIVNSRPLFSVSTDPQEEEALTPNHFLIGRSCGANLFGSFDDTELIGTPSWKTSQRLADHFWSRWMREYLPTLSPRYYQGPHYRDPTIGDVVLLVDHTLPRCTWPRGQIVATYPGPDGRTRIVDVRTSAGVLRRPATRLIVIVPASSPRAAEVQRTEGETVGDE